MPVYSDLNRKDAKTRTRVTDVEAVLNSWANALNTPPRQRLFRPRGTRFSSLLFTTDPDIAFQIKNQIYQAAMLDPRLELVYNETQVIADPANHEWELIARLRLKGLDNLTFTRTARIRG